MNEKLDYVRIWLDTIVGANDSGSISVKERIAYLAVCNGGYRSSDKLNEVLGMSIGPFTLGLSLAETVEHAYYVGMLSGMLVLGVDPYEILDPYVEEYIAKSLAVHDIEIIPIGIMEDGVLNIERLIGSYNHMNPEHKGDNN